MILVMREQTVHLNTVMTNVELLQDEEYVLINLVSAMASTMVERAKISPVLTIAQQKEFV